MRDGIKQEPEDNFYERVMVSMEEAGQTQIVDFLKELKQKEEIKAKKQAEKEAREAYASTGSMPRPRQDANKKSPEKWKNSWSPEAKTTAMPPPKAYIRKSPTIQSDLYRQRFID